MNVLLWALAVLAGIGALIFLVARRGLFHSAVPGGSPSGRFQFRGSKVEGLAREELRQPDVGRPGMPLHPLQP